MAEGQVLRDEGIEQVLSNASALWSIHYTKAVQKWFSALPVGERFNGEFFRRVALSSGTGLPHHPNAWGAMANVVLREWYAEGRIERSGGVSPATDPRAHARMYVLYTKIRNLPWRSTAQKEQDKKREALFLKLAKELELVDR